MLKKIKKTALLVLGTLTLALGVLGLFLPVLPTTPFLLVTSFCYLRSSRRLYHWLIHQRLLGAHIYNYITYRAVLKSAKLVSLVFLWVTLGLSMLLVNSLHVRAFLMLVGVLVSIHLLTLRTMEKEAFKKPREASKNDQAPEARTAENSGTHHE
jgi:uncharacterized membrane protein YbaN (DUF454 family)